MAFNPDRKREMDLFGPCPCGSGKPRAVCHPKGPGKAGVTAKLTKPRPPRSDDERKGLPPQTP